MKHVLLKGLMILGLGVLVLGISQRDSIAQNAPEEQEQGKRDRNNNDDRRKRMNNFFRQMTGGADAGKAQMVVMDKFIFILKGDKLFKISADCEVVATLELPKPEPKTNNMGF